MNRVEGARSLPFNKSISFRLLRAESRLAKFELSEGRKLLESGRAGPDREGVCENARRDKAHKSHPVLPNPTDRVLVWFSFGMSEGVFFFSSPCEFLPRHNLGKSWGSCLFNKHKLE